MLLIFQKLDFSKQIIKNFHFSCRVLDVRCTSAVSKDGIKVLTNLKDLEELVLFGDDLQRIMCVKEAPPDFVGLLSCCFELMPYLHVAVMRPETTYWNFGLLLNTTCRALKKLKTPCTLHLHHLALCEQPVNLADISFPQVRILYMECYDQHVGPMLPQQFPDLEEIVFVSENPDNLTTILNNGFGRDLKRLKIDFIDSDLPHHFSVFGACPHLYELCVRMDMLLAVVVPMQVNNSLRILRMVSFDCSWMVSMEHWLQAAPNLELLEIHFTYRPLVVDENIDEWSNLNDLVRQGACLRHLEKLVISFDRCYEPDRGVYPQRWFKRLYLDNFILTCTTHCQKLSQVVDAKGLPLWTNKYYSMND